MALSVNTNVGAMTALQYLSKTQGDMQTTQNAISTGMKVSSAKDDGAAYAIAQNMRGNVASYEAVTDSLNRGMSSVDVAMSAGSSISDLLIQMKQKALSASDKSLDTASRSALNNDFTAMRDQITSIVKNASFNGYNLLNGTTNSISALASVDGQSTIKVSAQNMSLSGGIVSVKTTDKIDTVTNAGKMVSTVQTSLKAVNAALAKLSAGSKQYSIQLSFSSKLSDTVQAGIGNLVDANMATESARLTALQTKQQLGVQALSIANSAPQTVLSLFQ
ncbi:flagellin [Rhizomicrobium palustre]|uniref:Flagellin n=1 Tax=Rhizomicrobium palustre TaxID=189966 RepID=A0A846MYF3_9PROT|nr:flagellin [Rhizomicrobium palustre]NIK88072.1 flagellin [Rhizomicrobium palustre]